MNSVSCVTVRHMFLIGLTQRSISSTAIVILRRIVDEQLALVGVQQQLLHAAADHVARRLVAADEDQQRLVQHVVGCEAVAVDLGVHEHAHQVVGRVRLPLRDRVRAELGVLRPSRASRR